jgi:hypothetical protein
MAAAMVVTMVHDAAASPGLIFHEAGRRGENSSVAAGVVDAETWLGLEAHYLHHLQFAPEGHDIAWGASLEVPMMLWLQSGGPDTGRLGVHGTWSMAPVRRFRVAVDAASHLAVQHDFMGTLVGWDSRLEALAGLRLERLSLGLSLGWRQGLSTLVSHSDYVRETYNDRYPAGTTDGIEGPKNGFIAFPTTRFSAGIQTGYDLTASFAVFGAGGLIFTPTKYEAGLFDSMMFGVWPFFAELGALQRF